VSAVGELDEGGAGDLSCRRKAPWLSVPLAIVCPIRVADCRELFTVSLEPFDFDRLFASGADHTAPDGQYLTVQVDEGWLVLPTGRVIAVEPGISGITFTQTVPPGRYPVLLSVAEYRASSTPDSEIIDERVAAARLVIRGEAVATWEPAVTAGQDVDDLGDGEFYGYGVDGGTGCFTDARSYQDLLDDDEVEWGDLLMDVDDRPTSPTALTGPDDEPLLVAFTTGCGDGSYPTWVGRTANGDIACFLTEFFLIGRS
jgi:hypothetical protein